MPGCVIRKVGIGIHFRRGSAF